MERMGYGKGYEYPHDAPEHFTPSENLPENVSGSRFYEPGELGAERQISERLRRWWGEERYGGARDSGSSGDGRA